MMKVFNKISKMIFDFRVKLYIDPCNPPSIISSNCIGGRIYKSAGIQYNTPTIGLWFEHEDFIKLISNLDFYLSKELTYFDMHYTGYPLARLGDVTIHLMHYENFMEAKNKWDVRMSRFNFEHIIILNTDRDGCDIHGMKKLHEQSVYPIVSFSKENVDVSKGRVCCLKKYRNCDTVGDLYTNYHELAFNFPFEVLKK